MNAQPPLFPDERNELPTLEDYEGMADNMLRIERQQIVFGDYLSDDERQLRCNAILAILARRQQERLAKASEPQPEPDPEPEPEVEWPIVPGQLAWDARYASSYAEDISHFAEQAPYRFAVYVEIPHFGDTFVKGTRWTWFVCRGNGRTFNVLHREERLQSAEAAMQAVQVWWDNAPLWITDPDRWNEEE